MITVNQRNEKGIIQTLGVYTESEFAKHYGRNLIVNFSNVDTDRCSNGEEFGHHDWIVPTVYAKVAYNDKDKLLTVDHLVGVVRAHRANYRSNYWSGRTRHVAYGHFRNIRTFQERKWAHAWDDEEFAPKIRKRRQGRLLPTNWDDIYGHNEKCWKFQSKRKHQWK